MYQLPQFSSCTSIPLYLTPDSIISEVAVNYVGNGLYFQPTCVFGALTVEFDEIGQYKINKPGQF